MTHFGFVHLEYGDMHRSQSMHVLDGFRTACARTADRTSMVIVDNARAQGHEAYSFGAFKDATVVSGDNAVREFSGWDKGVSELVARHGKPDIWIFTNDTLARHHGWSAQRAARFGSEIGRLAHHKAPWILGEVVDFPHSMSTPLGPCLEYVSTYCFVMNNELMEGLGQLSPGNEFLDTLVHDRFETAQAVFQEHVDPGYVEFVSAWLIADEATPDQKKRFGWAHEWHHKSPLNAQTFADLRMKARCCLAEALLSVRARKLGAELRSPYDARNARDRVRKITQYLEDKFREKRLLKKSRASG